MMKKLFYLLLVMAFLGVTITSCVMRKPCSAYGESKYYQIEKPFN